VSDILCRDATAIADEVRRQRISATEVTRMALDRAAGLDAHLNCFTAILNDTALTEAGEIDRKIGLGIDPGPLAGAPFAVKNLFDVAGVTTLAGSKILRGAPPAPQDAMMVARLRAAGAVLIGTNNMDEFAYGFTTQNAHYGPTRNPHDPARSAGGRREYRAARPGFGHERVYPRSGGFLRHFRAEADPAPPIAGRDIPFRPPARSCRPVRALGPRPCPRL
jgi:aspartyl-tRNA(Asn)/glutamyl-tRNA(Gln) amidotransferase subunit A